MVQRLTVQMCRAATVQEFLERFEIGKILGVGGAPPQPSLTAWDSSAGRISPTDIHSGFSVVKRGKNKQTGEEVAIKVPSIIAAVLHLCSMLCDCAC